MGNLAPLVGIVVLNFNGKDCLPQCLSSLQNISYERFFTVVVDNDSHDGSLEAAEAKFPQCSFIRNPENKGFAAGMNVGIAAALAQGAEWVWLFNNDAQADPQALSFLMAEGEQYGRAGLLSPWILRPDQTLWFGKGRVRWSRMRVVHEVSQEEESKKSSYSSQCMTGCALLIRRKVIEKIGLLDERFFLYYEDADFSLRALEAGFDLRVVPRALVWHREQSEANTQKLYYLVLSGLLFFQKQALFWQKPYLFFYVTIRRLKNYWDVVRGRDEAQVVRRAYDDFYHAK